MAVQTNAKTIAIASNSLWNRIHTAHSDARIPVDASSWLQAASNLRDAAVMCEALAERANVARYGEAFCNTCQAIRPLNHVHGES